MEEPSLLGRVVVIRNNFFELKFFEIVRVEWALFLFWFCGR